MRIFVALMGFAVIFTVSQIDAQFVPGNWQGHGGLGSYNGTPVQDPHHYFVDTTEYLSVTCQPSAEICWARQQGGILVSDSRAQGGGTPVPFTWVNP